MIQLDWHMLVALMAPQPVYKLFGKDGLGVNDMPPVEISIGDFIGYHNRKGGYGINEHDWAQFLKFADRHLGITKEEK